VLALAAEAPDRMRAFSVGLDVATRNAVRTALAALESDKVIPIRPVVLGGDDLTLLLPARFGFEFTRFFLSAFEEETRTLLDALPDTARQALGAETLRAGAGISYVQAHFPLADAIELAEDLCSWAKTSVQREVSALALHRVTDSAMTDYATILRNELTGRDPAAGQSVFNRTTAGPFVLEAQDGFVTTDALRALAEAAAELPKGPLREALGRFDGSRKPGDDFVRRLDETRNDPGRKDRVRDAIGDFLDALANAGFGTGIWREADDGKHWISPLSDLHSLLGVSDCPDAGERGA